jgi:hypothetical protein
VALCRAPWLHGHRSARLNISLDDLEDRGRRRHRAVLVALIVEDQPGPTMPSAPRESPVEPVVLDEQDISDMTGVRQVRPDVGSWSTPVSRLPGLKQCHPQCLGYPFYLRSYLGGVDSADFVVLLMNARRHRRCPRCPRLRPVRRRMPANRSDARSMRTG